MKSTVDKSRRQYKGKTCNDCVHIGNATGICPFNGCVGKNGKACRDRFIEVDSKEAKRRKDVSKGK